MIKYGNNKGAFVVLAYFLGTLGIHKFYQGKVGLGFLYLMFCWTGIPTIIGIAEALLALCDVDGR